MILVRGATGGAVEILEYLHAKLDLHFSDLRDRRLQLDPASPVFALEHDLNAVDLNLLRTSVREAVRPGLGARARRWWLPFVVYAAEVGYDYVGIEYWPPFEEQTPGWRVPADRSWLKEKFKQFATERPADRSVCSYLQHHRVADHARRAADLSAAATRATLVRVQAGPDH
jgi:hypothetical protein